MYFDLKRFRQDHDIRQVELCEVLNISQGRISQIEAGKTALPYDKVDLLVGRYGDEILSYKIVPQQPIAKSVPEPPSAPAVVFSQEAKMMIQNQNTLIEHFAGEIQRLKEINERLNSENERLAWQLDNLQAEVAALRNVSSSVDGAARSA